MHIILFCDNLTLYVPFSNHTPPYYSVVHAKMNINKLGYVFEGVDDTVSKPLAIFLHEKANFDLWPAAKYEKVEKLKS